MTQPSNRPSRSQTAISNMGTSAIAFGWPLLISLAVTPILVSRLGNDAYGVRGLSMMLIGYLAVFDLGLNGAIIKYLAEYRLRGSPGQIEDLLGTTFLTYTVCGLVGGFVIWFAAPWLSSSVFKVAAELERETELAFRLTGIGFFFSMLVWWGSAIPAGLQRFDIVNGLAVGLATCVSVGGLGAALLGYGLVGVVGASVIANGVAAGVYYLVGRKILPGVRLRPSFMLGIFKQTTAFGLHMVVFRVFSALCTQGDRLLIGIIAGANMVTYYIVPYQAAAVVHGVSGKMMQIILPLASELSEAREKDKLRNLFLRATNLCNCIGVGLAAPLIVLASPILTYWMSPSFAANATLPMQLLAVAFFLMGLYVVPSYMLPGVGYPRAISIGSIITGISSLLFYWVFVHIWGISGVALGMVLGLILTNAYFLIVSKRIIGVALADVGRIVWRPIAIGLCLGFPLHRYIVPRIGSLLGVLLVLLAFVTTYGVLTWFLGVFTREEKRSCVEFARQTVLKLSRRA